LSDGITDTPPPAAAAEQQALIAKMATKEKKQPWNKSDRHEGIVEIPKRTLTKCR
jgi:hypothetical protein